MSGGLRWELAEEPAPPSPEQLAYEKRVASNRRWQCLWCGRFVKSTTVRFYTAYSGERRATYECSRCGPMDEG